MILKIYVVLTIIYFIIYIVVGLDLFTAIVNSMTTVSTGGFSTISVFKNPIQQAATLILMFSSAQPLILYYYLYKGMTKRILRESQLISFTIVSVTGIILLVIVEGLNPLSSAFQVVSALSTTGYTSLNNRDLSSFGKLVLSILMIIGAGYGSTGGGIKQLRLIIILKHLYVSLKRRLLPSNTILNIKVSGRKIDPSELSQVFTLILLYIIVLVVSVLVFTAFGYSLADSLFESSSALATTGLSVGISGPALHPLLKLLLMIDMLMGRVEIIPFIYLVIVPLVREK
jgi:trk system potassium uptake protein TrkH